MSGRKLLDALFCLWFDWIPVEVEWVEAEGLIGIGDPELELFGSELLDWPEWRLLVDWYKVCFLRRKKIRFTFLKGYQ